MLLYIILLLILILCFIINNVYMNINISIHSNVNNSAAPGCRAPHRSSAASTAPSRSHFLNLLNCHHFLRVQFLMHIMPIMIANIITNNITNRSNSESHNAIAPNMCFFLQECANISGSFREFADSQRLFCYSWITVLMHVTRQVKLMLFTFRSVLKRRGSMSRVYKSDKENRAPEEDKVPQTNDGCRWQLTVAAASDEWLQGLRPAPSRIRRAYIFLFSLHILNSAYIFLFSLYSPFIMSLYLLIQPSVYKHVAR